MKSVLFLQSEEPDPYGFYNYMLLNHPVYRDEEKQITAVYGYKDCLAVLNDPAAVIPAQQHEGLNEYALTIAGKLARFSNPPVHFVAKQAARMVFQSLRPVAASDLSNEVFAIVSPDKLDWVEVVAKQVPVLAILHGLGFARTDRDFLVAAIGRLVKIMQPHRSAEQISGINDVSAQVYSIIERHILTYEPLSAAVRTLAAETGYEMEVLLPACVANLAGLLTQSYDACRGLLSNALLYLVNHQDVYANVKNDRPRLEKFVIEILRFDPPVHNTRRLATEDIYLTNHKIGKGEMILVVLAAANRDVQHFSNPNLFDTERSNNNSHLTFGSDIHACLANDFAVRMVTDMLLHFFDYYPNLRLLSMVIEFEAIINGRLPKSILISLT